MCQVEEIFCRQANQRAIKCYWGITNVAKEINQYIDENFQSL
jgi:hypothetical protein